MIKLRKQRRPRKITMGDFTIELIGECKPFYISVRNKKQDDAYAFHLDDGYQINRFATFLSDTISYIAWNFK